MQTEKKPPRRSIVISYFGCFVFSFAQILGFISTGSWNNGELSMKLLTAAVLAAAVLALPVSRLLLWLGRARRFRKLIQPSGKGKEISYPIFLLTILCAWGFYYLAFYPGIEAYDFYWQWYEYSTGTLSTHHPLLHTLLMCTIVDHFGKGPRGGVAIYCFLQLFSLAAVAAYALYTVQKLKIPRWAVICMLIFYAGFPLCPILGVSLTKDVFFATFLLAALVRGIKAAEEKKNVRHVLLLSLWLTLALLFRNNAVHAAAAVCIAMLIVLPFCRNRRFAGRIIACLLVSILLAEAGYAGLKKATGARDSSLSLPVTLSVPLQQIARVCNCRYTELDQEELNTLLRYWPEEELFSYQESISDPIIGSFREVSFRESPGKFFRVWASLGKRFPFTYMDAFLKNTLPLWYMDGRTIISSKNCFLELEDAYPDRDSKIPGLLRFSVWLTGPESHIFNIPVLATLSSMALYFWLLWGVVLVLLSKKRYEELFLPLLPWTYLLTLLFGPCILPRYCFASILCVPMLCAYLIHLANRGSDQTTETAPIESDSSGLSSGSALIGGKETRI